MDKFITEKISLLHKPSSCQVAQFFNSVSLSVDVLELPILILRGLDTWSVQFHLLPLCLIRFKWYKSS